MKRIRIFVSFDREHDTDLGARLETEAKRTGSTFELCGHSHAGGVSEAWTESSRARIRAADGLIVICGEHTDASPHVATELRIAQEEGKPYMLLWGRREAMCKKPEGAKPADAMYSWTRPILESQVDMVVRGAKPFEVPDNCKRQAP